MSVFSSVVLFRFVFLNFSRQIVIIMRSTIYISRKYNISAVIGTLYTANDEQVTNSFSFSSCGHCSSGVNGGGLEEKETKDSRKHLNFSTKISVKPYGKLKGIL